MQMLPRIGGLLVCLVFGHSASAATADKPTIAQSDFADFGRFLADLPDFASMSDKEVVDFVQDGIHGDDPDSTVLAIGTIAMLGGIEDWRPELAPDFRALPERLETARRQFSAVPDLSDFLIDYVGSSSQEVKELTERVTGRQELAWDPQMRRLTALTMGSLALAAYFSLDPVVHEFLIDWWQRDADTQIVQLLYAGRFTTEAADEIRIASLDSDNIVSVIAAAKGLTLSGRDTGLTALLANLHRRDFALLTVVEAIASFGVQAQPHLPHLVTLQQELDSHVSNSNDLFALDPWRVNMIVDAIDTLAALPEEHKVD